MVDVIVRVLPVFWCKHDDFPNHILGFLRSFSSSHLRLAPLMRLGTVRVRLGGPARAYTRGLCCFQPQGSPTYLVLRLCEGVSLCTRTGSTLAALPKAAPAGGILARSEPLRPVSIGPQGTAQKYMGRAVFSNVMACAEGRSSVRVVTRTAGMKLSRSTAWLLYSYCSRRKFTFLEEFSHISVTISHILQRFFEFLQRINQPLYILFQLDITFVILLLPQN